eukprot:gnl/MRDRNA2_/MRDRNA2_101861_c0_seq1.p1 gnl/MRDRNA2_/MRDRNA2_101861_c0~~gnl/MRDRNA2_/MRDRNA2_101861_c0_seq1.p1  ORF type:complete len:202 (+),score=47.05 gnl/MRDRNA2_/MRDRNA2_101861_c0_seq1:60-665(+)
MVFGLRPVFLWSVSELVISVPPRQPKETYLTVPKVSTPKSWGVGAVLQDVSFQDLDIDSDGVGSEGEFVGLVHNSLQKAAEAAWNKWDTFEPADQQLSLDEFKKEVERKGQKPPGAAVFLWMVAQHFHDQDLSKRTVVPISSLLKEIRTRLLEHVPFLDERRTTFDMADTDRSGDIKANEWVQFQEQLKKKKGKKGKKNEL